MSALSTWNPKVGLLMALAVILAVIVAFQGVLLYRVARTAVDWPQVTSFTLPLWKAPFSSPRVAGNASPGTGASVSTSDNDWWTQIEQFHNRMDQLFANTFAQPGGFAAGDNSGFAVPNMDLRDAKDHYVVQMDMPGADKSKIQVNIEGRLLSVSGRRETSNETKDAGNQVVRSERSAAEFERTILLPGSVKADAARADYTDGVLTIDLPKADKTVEAQNVTVH